MGIETWLPALLGQLVRHLLSIAAGLLAAYGVTADQATAVVGPLTAVIVSILMFIISQVWAAKTSKDQLETDPRNL